MSRNLHEIVAPVLEAAASAIKEEVESIKALSEVASKYPYYKCVLPFLLHTSCQRIRACQDFTLLT